MHVFSTENKVEYLQVREVNGESSFKCREVESINQ
jgi:hypothetical protein